MIVLDSCLVFTYHLTEFIQFCATHILILSGFESPHTVIFIKKLTGWFCCCAPRRVGNKTPAATPPPPGQHKPRPRRARRQAPPEPPRLGWPDWSCSPPASWPRPQSRPHPRCLWRPKNLWSKNAQILFLLAIHALIWQTLTQINWVPITFLLQHYALT